MSHAHPPPLCQHLHRSPFIITITGLSLHPYTNNIIQNMLAAFRHLLHPSTHHLFLRPATPPSSAAISAVRLQQTKFWSSKAKPDDEEREGNMAENGKPAPQKTSNVDSMTNSFGEGYATRSEEEGFGGVNGGNQRLRPEGCDKENVVHEKNHSDDYDRTQVSEVKEKEKGRNFPHGHHVG